MRRWYPTAIAVVATVTLLGALHVGRAATLPTRSDHAGAGSAVVGTCHTGPVSVTYHQSVPGGPVTALTVSGLAPSCDGGALHAVVTDGTGGNLAASTAPAAVRSGSATVGLTPQRPAEQVQRYEIVIVGS